MQLDDFVAETIRQIASGVQRGQEQAKEVGTIVNPVMRRIGNTATHEIVARDVEFDVAVTVVEGKGTKGGIGVIAGVVKLGAEGKSDTTNTSVNRVKFSVPVAFPDGEVAHEVPTPGASASARRVTSPVPRAY